MSIKLTRRALLTGIGSVAGASLDRGAAHAADEAPRVRLRLMETSDLHMFVLDWDYYSAKPDHTVGLNRVASLIRQNRKEAANTLLFDNGDFLQGNPLADYVFERARSTPASAHPMIAAMRELGYDAATLGNHEFNYGLDFLEASLEGASFPFVCANVERAGGAPFLPPHTVLERSFVDDAGAQQTLRIGVIGFVTPQIMVWDKARLTGKLQSGDIVLAAKRLVPELRARCDIVVALCHSGISANDWVEGEEHAALHLAAVPGIDVIMTGHAHRLLPGKDYAGVKGVDAVAGRLNGVPAVMPGFWGSHLGIIDLTLKRENDRWTIEEADVRVQPIYRRDGAKVEPLAEADAAVAARVADVHQRTLQWVEQPVGAIDKPIHSYFVWAGHDPATAVVNAAQIAYARPLLETAGAGALPLLSAMAPYRAGYTPDSFIDIAKGPVALRQAAGLYQYSSNTVVVVKLTGAQILEWLEFAARVFNTIDPTAAAEQPLIDKRVPSYNFDIISGLSYKIDVTRPPRYTKDSINKDSHRIVDLRFEGQPIDPAREFAVVTNSYRADGGGNVPALAGAPILLRAPDTNKDAVVGYFRSTPTVQVPAAKPWSFAPIGHPVTVYFDTGPGAREHIGDAAGARLTDGEPGYLRVTLTLA
ncbi:MAG: bifunctional 2',3'-cyclic-nucleotide 2'-phosphodiesterase/3'-nucleotidase [Hyphomicrobium sp.]